MLTAHCKVRLDDPQEILRELLEHYEEHGTVTLGEGTGSVVTPFGNAHLVAADGMIRISTEAGDETSLAYMKYGIAFHLHEFSPEKPPVVRWEGHNEVGVPPPYFREMTVVSTRDLTPAMRRVVLHNDDLERFGRDGIHARLLFPPKGRTPVWPVTGEDGCPQWPGGEDALVARVYTVRALDVGAGEMTIDILRHDGDATPGSVFAMTAEPGDIVGLVGPAGDGLPQARSLLLLGDETALPAIARILETVGPDRTARAVIEVAGPQERQPLPVAANISVEWLQRGERSLGEVATALGPDDIDEDTFVWAGCEFADFKTIRRHCRSVLGLKKDRHLVVAYWRRGHAGDLEE